MDMTTIAAAQASIKAVLGLAQGATAAAVDHQLKERLISIQAAILDTQAKLGDAQEERLSLLNQVADLTEKVRGFEQARAALASYELCEIESGKFLYKYVGTQGVAHYACQTCHNSGKVTVLQTSKTGSRETYYSCAACNFGLTVGVPDPVRYSGTYDVGGF